MGVEYTDLVWQHKELKGGKLLVMLALAHHANKVGESWPGMPLLMEKTRLTDRQIRRVINELATDGTISIKQRAIGRGKTPLYILFPDATKADILSDQEEIKADISDNKSGHLQHIKADISDTNYSHVRREPITEPTTEPIEIAANAAPPAPVEPVLVLARRKRKAKKPAAPKHPAVVAYHEEHSRWPNEKQSAAIAGVVTDLALWRLVLEKWNLRGYSRINLDGMFDWYQHPEKFAPRNGASNGTGSRRDSAAYERPPTANFTEADMAAHHAACGPDPF